MNKIQEFESRLLKLEKPNSFVQGKLVFKDGSEYLFRVQRSMIGVALGMSRKITIDGWVPDAGTVDIHSSIQSLDFEPINPFTPEWREVVRETK